MIAIMPRGGMSSEATHCNNFNSVGKSTQTSLTSGGCLVVGIGDTTATIKMPVSLSAVVIVLGDNSPSITTESTSTQTFDENGVSWQENHFDNSTINGLKSYPFYGIIKETVRDIDSNV